MNGYGDHADIRMSSDSHEGEIKKLTKQVEVLKKIVTALLAVNPVLSNSVILDLLNELK